MLTIETIKELSPEVKFKSSYKNEMIYEGECEGYKFELHVEDYRWEFEHVELSADLIEITDNCELVIVS